MKALLALGGLLAATTVLAETPIFVDRTAEVGVDFVHETGATGELYFPEFMGAGKP